MIRNQPYAAPRGIFRKFAGVPIIAILAAVMATGWTAGHRMSPGRSAVPPYYVALRLVNTSCCSPGRPYAPKTEAIVRATATGAAIATVAAPKPYFTFVAVSGEADDRTFVLAAQRFARFPLSTSNVPASRFFLLRIDPAAPAGRRATLTALPIRPVPKGVDLVGIAVSPDGSKLAVTSTSWISPGPVITRLHVFSTRTGAVRTWQGEAFSGYGPGAYQGLLSWAADSTTLTLIGHRVLSGRSSILLLDTARKGSDLVANSKVIKIPGTSADSWRDLVITPDGKTVVAVLEIAFPGGKVYQRLEKLDTSTGKPTVTLNYTTSGLYERVLWTSPTGRLLIVTRPAGNLGTSADLYNSTRHSPIPWHRDTMTAAW